MILWFSLLIGGVVAQRVWELRLATRNALAVRSIGGYEVGGEYYKVLVALHVTFFLGVILEFTLRRPAFAVWMIAPLLAFVLLQFIRVWCVRTLGVYWNTRVFVVPGMELVRRGPYRFMRHPNYAVVTLEMLCLPLMFGCYWCAVLFPLMNVLVLRKRIAVEEHALGSAASAS
jgi:methyltransferase